MEVGPRAGGQVGLRSSTYVRSEHQSLGSQEQPLVAPDCSDLDAFDPRRPR